jgi:hypothetical protein
MLSKVREQVLCSFEHHIQNSNLIFGSGDWSLRILLELQTPKPLVSIYKHGIVRYPLRRRKYILQ